MSLFNPLNLFRPLQKILDIFFPATHYPSSPVNSTVGNSSAIKNLNGIIANLEKEIGGLQKKITDISSHGGSCSHGSRPHGGFGGSSGGWHGSNGWKDNFGGSSR